MNRKMKRISALAALIALCLSAGKSWALVTDTVAVSVTISGALSVSASPNAYNFGSLGTDIGSISASAVVVTNNSTAFRETYSLSASNSNVNAWTLAATPGTNQFVLAATFSTARPAVGFVDGNHNLSTTSTACTTSVFSQDASYTCQSVVIGTALNLWFEIVTPTQITGASTDNSTVYITAAAG